MCDAFHDVMASSGGVLDGSGPLVAAFAEVWRRLSQGASAEWIDRTARHWDWYFDAYAEEADNRAHRRIPTVEEHFALRRKSGFVYAMIDLSQKAHGFELPRHAYDDPVLRRMLDITADVVDTLNDVHSVEKEESRGDLHNLVLAIERESGCDRRASRGSSDSSTTGAGSS
ncbi:terpene synthase family protein [Streptomyces sp. NPDC050355]|uniref:terpene synthase family protein n=1 Tax=Streptomyces sp. NPDC050355 TaxID=3365609 RepID=UPI00379C01BB